MDFVFVDFLNINDTFGDSIDLMGVRPVEVLLEEWLQYRREGHRTPQVAIWSRVSNLVANALPRFLSIYENPAYQALLLKDPRTGKRVYFYASVVKPGGNEFIDTVALERMNNDNIMTIPMAGRQPQPQLIQEQSWSWMSPCSDADQMPIIDINAIDVCAQPFAPRFGTQPSSVSVSASYHTSLASHGGAIGYKEGRTLRKQFDRAFDLRPDYLLINAWNEHIVQPSDKQNSAAPGLEGDIHRIYPDGRSAWVDNYSVEYTRDIEPTFEWGYTRYNLLKACVLGYRVGRNTCDSLALQSE